MSSEVKALKEKAQAGDAEAQFKVGAAYDFGHGAPKDDAEALKWYRMAAGAGNIEAANSIGSLFQEKKQYVEALQWYEKAAAGNSPQGTNNLAFLYDLGLGVPPDRKKAAEIYQRAAGLGWAEAMWNLANQYGSGQLGAVDLATACVWVQRAAKFAGPREQRVKVYAERTLVQLQGKLGAEAYDKCKEESGTWMPSARQN